MYVIALIVGLWVISWIVSEILSVKDSRTEVRQTSVRDRMRLKDPEKLGETLIGQMSGYFLLSSDTLEFLERALDTLDNQENKENRV